MFSILLLIVGSAYAADDRLERLGSLLARAKGQMEKPARSTSAIDQGNINTAVDAWLADATAAEAEYGPISSWDVSSVTDMYHMFYDATSFNGDLSSWDVSSVTTMRNMFRKATAFNGHISSWDVSSVKDMSRMFYDAPSFNGDLSSWDVSSVTSMQLMFRSATSFNGDLSSWDVSSVTEMEWMFTYASCLQGDPSSWWSSSTANKLNWLNSAGTTSSDQCPAADACPNGYVQWSNDLTNGEELVRQNGVGSHSACAALCTEAEDCVAYEYEDRAVRMMCKTKASYLLTRSNSQNANWDSCIKVPADCESTTLPTIGTLTGCPTAADGDL